MWALRGSLEMARSTVVTNNSNTFLYLVSFWFYGTSGLVSKSTIRISNLFCI